MIMFLLTHEQRMSYCLEASMLTLILGIVYHKSLVNSSSPHEFNFLVRRGRSLRRRQAHGAALSFTSRLHKKTYVKHLCYLPCWSSQIMSRDGATNKVRKVIAEFVSSVSSTSAMSTFINVQCCYKHPVFEQAHPVTHNATLNCQLLSVQIFHRSFTIRHVRRIYYSRN